MQVWAFTMAMRMFAIATRNDARLRTKGSWMSLTPFLRISRRQFAAGVLGLAAAGGFGHSVTAQSTPEPQASPSTGADELVVRIEHVGGLRPMEYALIQTPSLSIYADGRVIQPAPVIAIYPPVAITPLNQLRIRPAVVANIIERAIDAGLDREQTIVNPDVMDASTARITVVIGGKPVVSNIYALDVSGPNPASWDEETAHRFGAIQRFAGYVRSLATSLDSGEILEREAPYVVDRLQVVAFIPDPANPLPTGVPDVTAQPLPWPLETSLADLGAVYDPLPGLGLPDLRCAEVSGKDAARVVEVAATGNFISPWEDRGTIYGLFLNPLLPGDSSCQVPQG